jgi:hypothetical protein
MLVTFSPGVSRNRNQTIQSKNATAAGARRRIPRKETPAKKKRRRQRKGNRFRKLISKETQGRTTPYKPLQMAPAI